MTYQKPVAIIGAGQTREMIEAAMTKQGIKDVLILTPDEYITHQMSLPPIEIKPAPSISQITFGNTKEFVCKGKHQYRQVFEEEQLENGTLRKTSWVCQCGRKL